MNALLANLERLDDAAIYRTFKRVLISRPQADPITGPLLGSAQVPLAKAVLCGDCQTVSDGNQCCPACGSQSLLNLARVLNRS